MNKYEAVYITDPEKTDEQVTQVADSIKEFIEKEGGTLDHVEQWGKKKLSYIVKKQKYGYYTLLLFTAPGEAVAKFEKSLRHNESILKFITLKHDPRSALKPPAVDTTGSYNRDHMNGMG